MSESDDAVALKVIMIGDSQKLRSVSRRLEAHANLIVVAEAESAEYSYGLIRHCRDDGVRVNTVFIDPLSDRFDPHQSSLFILNTRVQYPDVVFVLLASEADIRSRRPDFPYEIRNRIDHYYRIDPSAPKRLLNEITDNAIDQCRSWHARVIREPALRRHKYDVALSFAGEDREIASQLARLLTERGIRVFYDDDQRASLWGANLYTTLYDVYAHECRFCLLLVSKAYRDKMWTNHERVAAQVRAFEMREREYILPVYLEDVSIPGLPPTVAHVQVSLGVIGIVDLLIRKLASAS